MADDWYYAQNNERKGPVPFAKLKAMAAAARAAPMPPAVPAAVLANQQADYIPGGSGQVLVINHPPVTTTTPFFGGAALRIV